MQVEETKEALNGSLYWFIRFSMSQSHSHMECEGALLYMFFVNILFAFDGVNKIRI